MMAQLPTQSGSYRNWLLIQVGYCPWKSTTPCQGRYEAPVFGVQRCLGTSWCCQRNRGMAVFWVTFCSGLMNLNVVFLTIHQNQFRYSLFIYIDMLLICFFVAIQQQVARALMYMACMYSEKGLRLVEGPTENGSLQLGNLPAIQRWALQFPPSDRERRRNDVAEELQGNRNPFIDEPQLAKQVEWWYMAILCMKHDILSYCWRFNNIFLKCLKMVEQFSKLVAQKGHPKKMNSALISRSGCFCEKSCDWRFLAFQMEFIFKWHEQVLVLPLKLIGWSICLNHFTPHGHDSCCFSEALMTHNSLKQMQANSVPGRSKLGPAANQIVEAKLGSFED